jgi:hypothetical protein
MRVPWRGTPRPPAALDDRRWEEEWRRRRIRHPGGFDPGNSTIMHDYARLDTIMHDFLLRFRLRLACGGQESFHLSSGCRSYRGRDGGQGLAGGVRSDLAIFFAFRHKKYFFLPLLTFIDLYPPLLGGWHRRRRGAGAGPTEASARHFGARPAIVRRSQTAATTEATARHFGAKPPARRRTECRPGRR